VFVCLVVVVVDGFGIILFFVLESLRITSLFYFFFLCKKKRVD
jgi:hypothetical protein